MRNDPCTARGLTISLGLTSLNLPFTVRDGSLRDASPDRFQPAEVAVRGDHRNGPRHQEAALAYGEGASATEWNAARCRSRPVYRTASRNLRVSGERVSSKICC